MIIKNKVKVVVLVILLYLSSIYLVNEESIVKAITDEKIKIDSDYIQSITEDFSEVIYKAYEEGELKKGRAFGTKGENFTKNTIIKPQMINLSLWNVTVEKMEDTDKVALTHKLETVERGLSVNHSGNITKVNDFYISPRWNTSKSTRDSILRLLLNRDEYNNSLLTHNFSYKGLKVVRKPEVPWLDQIIKNLISDLTNGKNYIEIAENETLNNYSMFFNTIIKELESTYNFSYDNIDEIGPNNESLPWYNETIANITEPYVLIDEDPSFDPYYKRPPEIQKMKNINPMNPISMFYKSAREMFLLRNFYGHKINGTRLCKGLILFDHNNDTYNMVKREGALPVIYINKSTGKDIYDDTSIFNWISDDYTIDFYINQRYNESAVSYNVFGQINGTNPDKTVILSSYYDSWWNQGVVDGAIPMATVLGIAKYLKELEQTYGIIPKYNVKFIGFCAEEYGYRGANYYAYKYGNEDIKAVIDLNQMGFFQNDPDVPLILNLGSNKLFLTHILDRIIKKTQYEDKIGDGTVVKTWYMPFSGPCNVQPFIDNISLIDKFRHVSPYTIFLLKDTNWTRHHRAGLNYTEGDSMKYYYPEDVNLTVDIIWNITKYFSINPDCWFDDESPPTYTYWDSDDNDNYYDTVNVTYKLDTIMPNEHVTVNLVLHPKFNLTHPFYGIRYRHRASKHYNVTQTGLNGYINVSLPENFPYCEYVVGIYLCNSTGDATMGIFDSTVGMTGLEIVDIIYNLIRINILEREQIYDIIQNWLHIEVKDFLIRLQDHRKVRNFLIDLIGYTRLSNDSTYNITIMAPPNEPPDRPDPIGDLGLGELKYYHWYRTKTSDPEGDKIRFQWKWNGIKYPWTVRNFNSDEYCYEPHRWWSAGEKTVMVRAKNPRNPNYFSEWRETTVTVDEGCSFSVVTSQTSQNNIFNPYVENSFEPSVVPVDENINFQGFSWGFSETPDYGYDIEGSVKDHGVSKNTQDSFDETGNKYVNFSANLSGLSVYCNRTLKVVNISSCYSMNQLGAKLNQDITFNDTTISKHSINNWTWDFDDGNISYTQNVSHNFSQIGVYNVSLNVTDSNGESSEFWQIVHVETNHSDIIDVSYFPVPGTLGCNVTLSAELWDHNESGISNAYVNISYPNGTANNFSMYINENSSYGYEYVFNDTMQVGWYYFTIFVTDNCGNTNDFAGCGFQIFPAFGISVIGELNKNIKDNISGSNFTCLVNGTTESISVYIQTNQTPSAKTKCMIYSVNDSTLIGSTEEKIISTGDEPCWVTYNFTGTKPSLTTDTKYILACWSNDTCYLYYNNVTDDTIGRYNSTTYGSPPSPISWDDEDPNLYSIYCTYSTVPEIISVSASPDPIGFGYNTTITADIEHYYTLVDNITVNITYPGDTFVNNSMTKVDDDTFQYIFDDTWLVGQYNYSIWVKDKLGGNCSGSGYSFNVSANATISVCTIKDSYDNNESVNLTDPPGSSSQIGYEYLDEGKVLHIWNQFDSYYFNMSSSIQLTNHYSNYWSHNVLMLGYYNNDLWNLIYRTDELNGFNKNIDSDNNTYVNVTLWKNLNYEGYDFRLAIRYHLGIDDNELKIIPYIKNLGQDNIPYVLGFGWEMKDIQINMTPTSDYINVNKTMYYLNQTLDNTYSDLPEAEFYLMENITDASTKSLYLRWNQSLTYKLCVKSREGQYNAPVTLFIKVGPLNAGQEKYTSLYWYDSEQVTYYFDSFDDGPYGEAWAAYPNYMVDGSMINYASTTTNGDVELCDENNCSGDDLGTISKVELRVSGYYSGSQHDIILRPVFGGAVNGLDYHYVTPGSTMWSQWFDITNDPFAPQSWDWNDVESLDCDVEAEYTGGPPFTLYCCKVEIRVTYALYNYEPAISNPVPVNGVTGVSLQPVLNITVTDPDSDDMNISWLSNSSGSWQIFGINNSIGNGTYHQNFSNASVNGQWWYWMVNVSDGEDYTESTVYKFYTGYQSKIENTGSTDFKGYLLIQIEFYNTTNSTWELDQIVINETSLRVFNASSVLGLDTLFNPQNISTSSLSHGNGTYQVYTCLRDPEFVVLDIGTEELVATYQFTVSFS